jgi:hypothetical protein
LTAARPRCNRLPALLLLLALVPFAPPGYAEDPPAGPAPRDAAPDSAAGPVRFHAPRGWTRVASPDRDVHIFAAPTSHPDDAVTLIVSVGTVSDPDDFNFRERFDDFIALTLKGLEPRKRGAPRPGNTSQGLPMLTQQVAADNGAGRQTIAKFVAIDLNDRLAGFSLMATSEKLFKQFERDFDRLVAGAAVTEPERGGRKGR